MNNTSQLGARNTTASDFQRKSSKLRPRRSQHSRHRRTKDCRMRSNKSWCAGDVSCTKDNPYRGHQSLMHKPFLLVQVEEI
ncbi:hypothetical protein TNCV_1178201 [Trichonephila clavipes]|nr:hypothetical protein TNCV_1178201 [Trichonephila clavipes]